MLQNDAQLKNITSETFVQFSKRVKRSMEYHPIENTNKIIESMDKSMKIIIQARGQCIKY